MGLDMYAYSANRAGARQDYWDGYDFDEKKSNCSEPKSLAYWRKHPNLHGWMERLWESKGCPGDNAEKMFNGVELELTWDDLDALEQDILNQQLPETQGFFFGDASDDYYREQDLKFIQEARADLFLGLKVFYNSSW
jgi:hypothetical protein